MYLKPFPPFKPKISMLGKIIILTLKIVSFYMEGLDDYIQAALSKNDTGGTYNDKWIEFLIDRLSKAI